MKLLFTTNKMVNMFNSDTKFIVLQKAIIEVKDIEQKEKILSIIDPLNVVFKIFKNAVPEMFLYEDFISNAFDIYMNRLICFIPNQLYKKKYAEVFKNDVLSFWNELKNNKEAKKDGRTFIKMFDEIHEHTLKHNTDIFNKSICNLKGLVRGANGNHLSDYEWMIPKDEYSKNNRWNPDGKAFLYLGYGEDDEIESINVAIETCCREIRLEEGSIATICRFTPNDVKGKLLDLSIDEDIVQNQEDTMNNSIQNKFSMLMNDDKFMGKIANFKAIGEERSIRRIIKRETSGMVDRNKVERYLSSLFINEIVEAIFVPVDSVKDSKLEAYIPFRFFAEYLIEKGYSGIIHKSTRMDMKNKKGKNVILFNISDASICKDTMKLFKMEKDKPVEVDEDRNKK